MNNFKLVELVDVTNEDVADAPRTLKGLVEITAEDGSKTVSEFTVTHRETVLENTTIVGNMSVRDPYGLTSISNIAIFQNDSGLITTSTLDRDRSNGNGARINISSQAREIIHKSQSVMQSDKITLAPTSGLGKPRKLSINVDEGNIVDLVDDSQNIIVRMINEDDGYMIIYPSTNIVLSEDGNIIPLPEGIKLNTWMARQAMRELLPQDQVVSKSERATLAELARSSSVLTEQ